MARIRTIKPQFFLNEELSELPAMVRLLFIGLWTQADREGRLLDRPKRIKAEIFPYDNFDMERGLKQLSDAGFIIRYKVNANGDARILAPEQPINELALIQIINFSKHQKIDKVNEKESDFPEPVQVDYEKTITRLPKDEERNGKEWKGMEDSFVPVGTDYELEYKSLIKDKKSIFEFIKNKCPSFIDPYVDFWNIFAKERGMSSVQALTENRKKKFKARIKEPAFNFIEVLRKAGQSDFLLTTGKWFGFDWVLENSSNYLKVLEGNYDNGKDKNKMLTESKLSETRLEQARENSKKYELQ